jgi:hypothetical protein
VHLHAHPTTTGNDVVDEGDFDPKSCSQRFSCSTSDAASGLSSCIDRLDLTNLGKSQLRTRMAI